MLTSTLGLYEAGIHVLKNVFNINIYLILSCKDEVLQAMECDGGNEAIFFKHM